MSNVRCRQLPVSRIDEQTVKSMFQLFSRFYSEVDFEQFYSDLQEKDECVLLSTGVCADGHSEPDGIVGFTTLRRERDPGIFGATYLFSGDTVLDPRCWGRRILERAFFWTMLREKLRAPWRRLHWMLISKGFVTYLMMVRNFPSSFPRCDQPTPARLRERLDRFYSRRYPETYCVGSGLVRATSAKGAVKGRLAVPKGAMLRDPDVKFFVRKNPGYGDGDELACIAEVRVRDFARHFATAVRRRRNRRAVDRREMKPRKVRPAIDSPRTV